MNKNPKVSIVVPCFKQAEYLPHTLDSVLAQTYDNWECVVVDDGSPDDTRQVVEKYSLNDSRISCISQANKGLSAARNFGIANTSGTYILPLDADDLIESEYIELAVQYLEKHNDVKVVYCRAAKFGAVNCEWDLPEYSFDKLLFENQLFCSSLYRRSDFEKTSGYNESMRSGLEDWDFWLSFLGPDDKVYRIDKILFRYRIKNVSMLTEATRDEQLIELRRQVFDNHRELYDSYVRNIITYVRRCNAAQSRIDKINASLSMRIGRALTLPFGKIRDVIKSLRHGI